MNLRGKADAMSDDQEQDNRNGLRRAATWVTIIVGSLVIGGMVASVLGGYFRKDFEIDMAEREMGRIGERIEAIREEIGNIKLEETTFRTNVDLRLKSVETSLERLSTVVAEVNKKLLLIESIDRGVRKLMEGDGESERK